MNKNTKMLTQAGLMVAMSQILSYVKLFQLPQGGAVTIASSVPIIIFSILWGGKNGLIAATVYGLLQFLLGGEFILNIASVFLDYIIAFGVLGIVGFFPHTRSGAFIGTTVAMIIRFFVHFLSGWLLFYEYAPVGQSAIVYSLTYNSYIFPELVIALVVLMILYTPIIEKQRTKL